MRADFDDDQLAKEVTRQLNEFYEAQNTPAEYGERPHENASPEEERRRRRLRLRWNEVWVSDTMIFRVGRSYRIPCCASYTVPQRGATSANSPWLVEPQSESSAASESEVVVSAMPLSFSSKPSTSSVEQGRRGKTKKASWWSTVFR